MSDVGLTFSRFAVAGEGWLPLVSFGYLPELISVARDAPDCAAVGAIDESSAAGQAVASGETSDIDGASSGRPRVLPAH